MTKSANLNLAIFESSTQGLSYACYLINITDSSILTHNKDNMVSFGRIFYKPSTKTKKHLTN